MIFAIFDSDVWNGAKVVKKNIPNLFQFEPQPPAFCVSVPVVADDFEAADFSSVAHVKPDAKALVVVADFHHTHRFRRIVGQAAQVEARLGFGLRNELGCDGQMAVNHAVDFRFECRHFAVSGAVVEPVVELAFFALDVRFKRPPAAEKINHCAVHNVLGGVHRRKLFLVVRVKGYVVHYSVFKLFSILHPDSYRSFNPYLQSIVSGQNVVGQNLYKFIIHRDFVADVRQIGAARLELADDVECFAKTQVRGVLFNSQSIDNQSVKTLQFGHFGVGNCFGVGDVGELPDAEARGGQGAVQNVYRRDRNTLNIKRFVANRVKFNLRCARVVRLAEGVGVLAADGVGDARLSVERNGAAHYVIEGSYVVDASGVVFVLVGYEHGVNLRKAFAQSRLPQVGPRVDEQVAPFDFNVNRTAQSLVLRVNRLTHRASAPHNRNAVRRPRA